MFANRKLLPEFQFLEPETKKDRLYMQKKMILKSDMRVYFDMDGTIAKWRDVPVEESRKPGYYIDLEPETELLDFLAAALKADENMNILSSYYTDTRALLEKKKWLDKYLPGISSSHCLFVPYGKNKAEFVETMLHRKLGKMDILVDEPYTEPCTLGNGRRYGA